MENQATTAIEILENRTTENSRTSTTAHRNDIPSAYIAGLSKTITRRVSNFFDRADGHRLIKDIVLGINLQQCQELCDKVKATTQSRNSRLWGIVYHPETTETGHAHVFHRCLYYGSYCRCRVLRNYHIKRRRSRYTPDFSEAYSVDFWQAWFKYFLQTPRRILYLEIAGMDYRDQIRRLEDLQSPLAPGREDSYGDVEGSWPACQSLVGDQSIEPNQNTADRELSEAVNNSIDSRNQSKARLPVFPKGMTKKKDNLNFLLSTLEQLLVIPIESSCDTSTWLSNSDLLFFNRADPDYKKACSAFLRKTQFLNFDQLYSIHTNPNTVGVYFQRSTDYYYNLEESFQYVENLLQHQYGDGVTQFVRRLYDVTEKIIPKKNTISIRGPANCGKSWFADMVTAYYLNIGHVKNFVRGTSFPLNDCVNRRILLWNEPSICPSQYETVKMLAGGDPCPAAVKYEGDGKITRTPLIITSNHAVLPENDAIWSTRCYFEHWKSSPFLKDYSLYPHPLTFAKLIQKYIE